MKTQQGQAYRMCVVRGKKIGTQPGTTHCWVVVDGIVWLVTDKHAVNNGSYGPFMEKVRENKVQFTASN